mmetsp:Transcript_9908/g.21579  ORF Transcript_9908/g.21579 Transcript_9908/m.21579 type:complete len:354 (+) Transcript_9908:426-1487(+)
MLPPRKEPPRRRRSRPVTPPSTEKVLRVHHNYHDRAHEVPSSTTTTTSLDEWQQRGNNHKNHDAVPFPLKLHDLLERVEQNNNNNDDDHNTTDESQLISWQPHGRCFVIHRPAAFVEHILPRYFPKIHKLASFQRQLNLYGFRRITQGRDRGAYYHEYFLRGKLELAASNNIGRCKVKGTRVRAKSNPQEEPDFYAMEWVGADAGAKKDHNNSSSRLFQSVSSGSLNANPPTTALHPHDADLLMEWGHSFYALDTLPDDGMVPATAPSSSIHHNQAMAAAIPPRQPLSNTTRSDQVLLQQHSERPLNADFVQHGLGDDNVLHFLLQQRERPPTKTEDDNEPELDELLEQVVSW